MEEAQLEAIKSDVDAGFDIIGIGTSWLQNLSLPVKITV